MSALELHWGTTLNAPGDAFLTPQQPLTGAMPALALGVTLAPARFTLRRMHVSVLELGVGVGTEGAGRGMLYGLTLLEVGVAL